MDPFRWGGVGETQNFFAVMLVDSLAPEAEPEGRMEIRYKPEETEVTLAAKRSYLGQVYLDWAQYPVTEVETLPPPQEGYIVHFIDLRYVQIPSAISRGRRRRALSAGVELDKHLRVVGDVFGAGQDQVVAPEPSQR